LWGETYDNRQLADLLQVQEQISHEISEKLRLRLTGEDQQRLDKTETQNTEAYQLYLQGRFYWNKYTDEGFRKSIGFFKQAIEKDSNYALAYSGLADSYSLLGEQGAVPSSQAFPQARAYAEKALALDEKLANAHLSLGIVKLFYDWNLVGGEKELRRAKELDPNNPQVHHFYGHYLQWAGRLEEARAEMQRGIELDPTNLIINAEFGFADYYLRRYDPAIAQLRKTLELDQNFVLASVWLAQAYEQKGMYQEALAELQRAKTIAGNGSWITAEIGCVDAFLGKRAEALKTIKELTERRSGEYIDPGTVVYVYLALGDKDQSFTWLEKAYQERAGSVIPWMKFDPKFDSVREDARFKDLLRRIGLPE
jgi:tetratricopeptide (TPR) repeat protein